MSKNKAPTTTSIASLGPASEIDGAYYAWASYAGDEERARISELINTHDLSTSVGLVRCCQDVIVETLKGSISPSVSAALVPWVQMIAAQVQLASMMSGAGAAKNSILSVAFEMKQKVKLHPHFSEQKILPDGAADVIDAELEPARERLKVAT